ncbi:hypothetical protein AMC86_PD00127 (plasmid) [Rhizobium phaseoli]|nr:hypothetical protein AMC88_PD00727 [Rhizobium phaseoli]ANL56587.1 hypothetical protein AMC86_PD00127 [Rhizobium phaseoli]ANL63533.1 hypothetical protein AMC85_PD00728 [Rhizobium phaseoli]
MLFLIAQQGAALAAGRDEVAAPAACVQPKERYEATYGIALDPERPFYVDIGPHRYAVPWKYLHPRPPKVMASCKLKGLGVQFWIPDGEAPERDLFWKPEFNPSEKGRPTPTLEDWVIKITTVKYYETQPPADTNPDRLIANVLQLNRTTEQRGELTVVKTEGPEFRDFASFTTGPEQSLLFTCLKGTPRQVCQGFLDLKEEHLAVHFLAPGEAIPFHANIGKTLARLLRSWKLPK